MSIAINRGSVLMADFVAGATPPAGARQRAAAAVCDTVGVILAGAAEPAAHMVQAMAREEGRGECRILGIQDSTGPSWAALANGVAAHALDYDDMCFVSLAHPSCALVAAALATAEMAGAPGRTLLDGYVAGFEVECRLGNVMNPRHYHERGWHCTSTIGTIGAAAAAARILGLDPIAVGHALGIAASAACGLKENIGSMVKPLHAGMAARNGVMSALLAKKGFTASERALDGPQGFLAAMDSQHTALDDAVADLGVRWEIVDTGITVKLYPSCAATHPPLDALLDLRRRENVTAANVESIEVDVDSMTPRLLIHDRPTTGLEAKFSMPFCAAAAIVFGWVGIDTFQTDRIHDVRVKALMPRVTMRVDPAFDQETPLSHARVSIRFRGGRVVQELAKGARGYPAIPASEEILTTKFLECARRTLPQETAERLLPALRQIESVSNVRALTVLCQPPV